MATFTGKEIRNTYDAILKLEDNDGLSTSLKRVTDGFGVTSPLQISENNIKFDTVAEGNGFKTPTGTSTQFLMADGSVNSNTYQTTANAFSGAYADLTGKPTLFDGDYNSLTNLPSLFSGSYTDLTNKPTTITVAQANAIDDNSLKVSDTGRPAILSNGTVPSLNSGITAAEIRSLIGAGNSSFSGSYNDLTDLPTLFSGSYTDLADKPTTITAQQIIDISTNNLKVSDTGTPAILSNGTTPTLNSGITATEIRSLIGAGTGDGTSNFSGNYNDLSNKPTTISAAQITAINVNSAKVSDTGRPAILSDGSTPSLNSGITAAEVRGLIGAGTSNLTLGTTSTTALKGDTTTISASQITAIANNSLKISDTGLPAILSDGNAPSLNTNITAAEVRTLIGAGTGNGSSNFSGSYTDLTDKPTIINDTGVPAILSQGTTDKAPVLNTDITAAEIRALIGAGTGNGTSNFSGSYNDLTNKPSLFDGDYNSLSNLPSLFDGDYNSLINLPILFDGDYNSLSNLPTLAPSNAQKNVQSDWNATSGDAFIKNKPSLFSGNYNDLTNKPTIINDTGVPAILSQGTTDKVPVLSADITAAEIRTLIGAGTSSFDGNYNSLSNKPSLFDGDYNSLSNLPSLFDGDYNSLSNLPILFTGAYSDLTGKPNLFSGDYNDLANKPTIVNDTGKPAILSENGAPVLNTSITATQVRTLIGAGTSSFNGSYNSLTNKPTLFDGDYNSLSNKPTIVNDTGLPAIINVSNVPSLTGTISAADIRGLIGAGTGNGTSNFSGSYNDLTNKPTIINDTGKPAILSNASGNPELNQDITALEVRNVIGLSTQSSGATASTLALRNGSGDIYARLFRSTYQDQSTISGAIAYRVNNGADNYVRYCSSPSAVRTWIGAGTSNFNGDYNSLTNKPILFDGDYNSLANKPTIINDTGLPAILSNGTTPALNSGITGEEIRSLIGAGTGNSNFDGNYNSLSNKPTTISAAQASAITANSLKTSDTGTPAILSNGSTPSLNSGITAAEVRNLIGAGTGSSNFSGNYNDLSNKPTIINDTGTPAILSNGSTPSLNSGISAAEIRSLIGAGTSSTTGTVTGGGSSGYIAKWGSTTGISDSLIFQNFSNVAIGAGPNPTNSKLYIYRPDSSSVVNLGNALDRSSLRLRSTTADSVLTFSQLQTGSAQLIQSSNTGGTNGRVLALNTYGGNVAIRKDSASYSLDVSGTIRATGDVIAYSDVRTKKDISTIENALEKVNNLRGVNYTRKDDDSKNIGVIAQEIEKVLPEVVKTDEEGMKAVSYGNIAGVLIEAIKELKNEVEQLKAELNGSTK